MDLDRYYTPDDVADRLFAQSDVAVLDRCVDSACGDGSLLRAAKRAFKSVACAGIDKDRAAIRRLRLSYPDWQLSVADVLSTRMHPGSSVLKSDAGSDLLALNPPFSFGGAKSVSVRFQGEVLRSSVAMAHILRSAELFAPTEGAIAIVPESLLFAEVDEAARQRLSSLYRMKVVSELKNTTFRGARANAVVVRLTAVARKHGTTHAKPGVLERVRMVRGGLPVFESISSRVGRPYLHSTDLLRVASTGSVAACRRVAPIGRGMVSGAVILLPRVGMPLKEAISPVYLRSKVQLSDCVIALSFENLEAARRFASALRARWKAFAGLYRGTGARYVTRRRLEGWLADIAF
jgi:hypothetical protein